VRITVEQCIASWIRDRTRESLSAKEEGMTREEALQRIVDNNFRGEYGFDLQILVDCMVVAREKILNSQFPSEDCISGAELLKHQRSIYDEHLMDYVDKED
jgi:hypothetical protein